MFDFDELDLLEEAAMAMRHTAITANMGVADPDKVLTETRRKDQVIGRESDQMSTGSTMGEESTDEGLTSSDGESSGPGESARSHSRSSQGSDIAFPSLGSAGHFEGTCSRCCFFPKGRCLNGAACNFCHFDHEKRPRKKRSGGTSLKAADKAMEEKQQLTDTETCMTEDVRLPTDWATAPTAPAAPTAVPALPLWTENLFTQGANEVIPGIMPVAAPPIYVAASHVAPRLFGQSSQSGSIVAQLSPEDDEEARELRRTSRGRPVKVWVANAPAKLLNPGLPAKKRPPYPDLVPAPKPLDSSCPVKKRMPSCLLGVAPR